ncbi:chemotaxis protein CheW [Idiomarina aquatica]|uniref:Chemotaxis protein CheW n=1 Tax=Idiomarina aquatica TaxID=1327752 RepID=A0AA94EDH0_9GAMM|nr:chemotaxis protein CheW [Idiomarina aquatica]RUO42444.1 chemotaxis protein CheW [Idiomarina aquatica]
MTNPDENEITVDSLKILTFVLDDELFAIEISGIQEVLEFKGATKVPKTPPFMLGVINLRGKVIPIVDLREQFELGKKPRTVDTCVIIVQVTIDGEETPLGILADAVKEVLEVPMSEINPPPRIGNKINSAYIFGMAKIEEEFVILLRLAKIFSADELQSVVGELTDAEVNSSETHDE